VPAVSVVAHAVGPVVRKLDYTDPRGDGHFSGQAEQATFAAPSDDGMDITAIRIRLDSSGLRIEADLVAAYRTDAVYYADFTDEKTGCYVAISLGGGSAEGYYLTCAATGTSDFVFVKSTPDDGNHLAAFIAMSQLPPQVSGHHKLTNVYVESRLSNPANGSFRYDYANAPKNLDPV
jgi:hypothetical protein